ncbi:MAG TPA: preprotein translocase subunit SecE [Proteobacteria bacterium]|nr:MAG: preprotein translocase subunit SecE [Deltaproteobacteria bacterium]HDJ27730.1 preprotein translocase subunit SecE [Pseudomonadota bacterium]
MWVQVFRGLKLADIREGVGNLVQYFQDSKVELKKVTWPSRKETLGLTWVVLIFVIIISLFLGVSDLGLSKLVKLILGA